MAVRLAANERQSWIGGNHHDLSALFSFNTLRTHSPSSFTDSSSDLDTELQCCLDRLPKRKSEDQMENLSRMIYLSLSSFSDRVWGRQIEAFVVAATFSLFTAKLVNYI
ncbi:uncharacterized protein LOC111452435 isoform X3 [Cucurbita moschata]|uniref:Uncharacterized protein LOC111452435 isoform X3 n=1 Tax=Cucurbita moschata TaxID=3662 RepID=A0A6J1GAQ8_CUCMO|nr:uncharacterized protein LOC111452435 isoform X3 [Cucurbita moschata]